MAKELHALPHISTGGGLGGQDLVLVKKTVSGTPLDFKADINTIFSGYLNGSDVGTEIGDLFRLVDDGLSNAGLPAISGNLLTNLNIPQANATIEGAVTLTDVINGAQGVTNGFAATPKAVADLNQLTFKKAGGDLSGAIKLPNNTPLRWTLAGGASIDVLNLDANNDFLIGNDTLAPDEIKMYTSNQVSIYNQAGILRFQFKEDGTSSGVRALDVSAAAKTGIPAGTVDSQIGVLATGKLSSNGGILTGNLTANNNISLRGDKVTSGDLHLASVDTSDRAAFGDITNAATIFYAGAGGFVFNSGGADRLTISNNGTFTGLNSNQVAFPTGTGGVVATDVQAALSWLGSNTLNTSGGSVSGSIALDNDLAYQIKNAAGTVRNIATITSANALHLGDSAHTMTLNGSFFEFRNSLDAVRLTMADTGFLTGPALQASAMNLTASGGVTENNIQGAIYGLDTRKLNRSGGEMSGALTLDNNIFLRSKNSGGTVRDLIGITSGGSLILGNTASAVINRATSQTWQNSSSTTILSLSGTTLSGTALQAASMNFTGTGGLTSTDVQAAINEVNANALSGEAAEFTGTINFANNIGITTRNAANTSNLNLIKMNTGNVIGLGEATTAGFSLRSTGQVSFQNSLGATVFAINPNANLLSGFSADKITTTAAGNISAGTVQSAIAELDNEKLATGAIAADSSRLGNNLASAYSTKTVADSLYLGITAKAASATTADTATNSTQLGGLVVSNWARKNAAQSISGVQTFTSQAFFNNGIKLGDNDSIAIGDGEDIKMYTNGNTLYTDISSTIGNYLIRDGSTNRFSFARTTGAFAATGTISEGGSLLSSKYLGITANASTATRWANTRTLTTTLSGDLSGSGSMSVNGSGNATVTILASVTNDSHTHDGRYYTETESDGRYLATGDTAANSSKLGGNLSSAYSTTVQAGNLYLSKTAKATSATTADQLGGNLASAYSLKTVADTLYLSKTAKAASATTADQLGGLLPSNFARRNAAQTLTGIQTFSNQAVFSSGLRLDNSDKIRFGNVNEVDLEFDATSDEFWLTMNAGVNAVKIRDGSTDRFTFDKSTGNFTATGNIAGTSDERVKSNIVEVVNALDGVRAIGGQTFDRIDMECPRQMGVIAQTVERYFPEAVTTDEKGRLAVAYGNLTAGAGFAAISELADIVDSQAETIAELKQMVTSLLELKDDIAG